MALLPIYASDGSTILGWMDGDTYQEVVNPSGTGKTMSWGAPTTGVKTAQTATTPKTFGIGGTTSTGVTGSTGGVASGTSQSGAGSTQPNLGGSSATNVPSSAGGGGLDYVSAAFSAVDKVITNLIQITNTATNTIDAKERMDLMKKYYGLAEQAQDFSLKQGEQAMKINLENLGLARENVRLAQTAQQEQMLGSGTSRYQSEVAFNQAQQDRAKNQKFLAALAKGIAAGIKNRGNAQLGPNQPAPAAQAPQTSPYAATPTVAGVGIQ